MIPITNHQFDGIEDSGKVSSILILSIYLYLVIFWFLVRYHNADQNCDNCKISQVLRFCEIAGFVHS